MLKKKAVIIIFVCSSILSVGLFLFFWHQKESKKVTFKSDAYFEITSPPVRLYYRNLEESSQDLGLIELDYHLDQDKIVYELFYQWQDETKEIHFINTGELISTKVFRQSQPDYLFSIDYQAEPIVYYHNNPERGYELKKEHQPSLGWLADSYSYDFIFIGFDFQREDAFRFAMIAGWGGERLEGNKVTMQVRNIGVETKQTPLGEIDCYTLEFKPTGLFTVIPGSTYRYWYAIEPPHYLVETDADGWRIQLVQIEDLAN